jgi:dimethylhistidine N-methyltransferase
MPTAVTPALATDLAVYYAALEGLTGTPKTLPPWLFYDEAGSALFERITELPEYYLTRTERAILADHAEAILAEAAGPARLTLVELGAGTATKTGLLLAAAVRRQRNVIYQPVDVSDSALEIARASIEADLPGVTVRPQIANYTVEPLALERPPASRTLALSIGSSIGNFAPEEAVGLLANLRTQLLPGDSLLLGVDLGPGSGKDEATLLAAYDDDAGVTAAFNRNILIRLNRELGTDFQPEAFAHRAFWNPAAGRVEMHLEATSVQRVRLPGPDGGSVSLLFAVGETIHTENSYKFTPASLDNLLRSAGFTPMRIWNDAKHRFAVTLAML